MGFIRDKETNKIVDPERNIIMESRGGRKDGFKHWEIKWNNDVFSFTAKDTKNYGGETKNIPVGIEWFIASIDIPDSLKSRRSEIMRMIQEALEAKGVGARFKGPVTVNFDPRLVR